MDAHALAQPLANRSLLSTRAHLDSDEVLTFVVVHHDLQEDDAVVGEHLPQLWATGRGKAGQTGHPPVGEAQSPSKQIWSKCGAGGLATWGGSLLLFGSQKITLISTQHSSSPPSVRKV